MDRNGGMENGRHAGSMESFKKAQKMFFMSLPGPAVWLYFVINSQLCLVLACIHAFSSDS